MEKPTTAFKDVKFTLTEGFLRLEDYFTPASVNGVEDLATIIGITRRNLKGVQELSRSLEVTMRYHQGRVLWLARQQNIDLGFSKHELQLVDRVFALFLSYEWLLPYFYGKTIQVGKLTFYEISKLRDFLAELIQDYDLFNNSFEGETSSGGYQDVTMDSSTV